MKDGTLKVIQPMTGVHIFWAPVIDLKSHHRRPAVHDDDVRPGGRALQLHPQGDRRRLQQGEGLVGPDGDRQAVAHQVAALTNGSILLQERCRPLKPSVDRAAIRQLGHLPGPGDGSPLYEALGTLLQRATASSRSSAKVRKTPMSDEHDRPSRSAKAAMARLTR